MAQALAIHFPLEDLGEDETRHIFSFLAKDDLKHLRLVNKEFDKRVCMWDKRMQKWHLTTNKDMGQYDNISTHGRDHLNQINISITDSFKSLEEKKSFLISHRDEITDLSVNISTNMEDIFLQDFLLPNLECLEYRQDEEEPTPEYSKLCADFIQTNLGSLQKLKLRMPIDYSLMTDTTANIKYLELYKADPIFTFRSLIKFSKSLETIKITDFSTRDESPLFQEWYDELKITSFPKLRHLYLQEVHDKMYNTLTPLMAKLEALVVWDCLIIKHDLVPLFDNLKFLAADVNSFELIHKCAATVETFIFSSCNREYKKYEMKVRCPQLKHMIFAWNCYPDYQMIRRHKPHLQTVCMSTRYDQFNFGDDFPSLTRLIISDKMLGSGEKQRIPRKIINKEAEVEKNLLCITNKYPHLPNCFIKACLPQEKPSPPSSSSSWSSSSDDWMHDFFMEEFLMRQHVAASADGVGAEGAAAEGPPPFPNTPEEFLAHQEAFRAYIRSRKRRKRF